MSRAKRPRTPVACQRCKSRKQRCDGKSPTCGNCQKSKAECIYSRHFAHPASQVDEQLLETLERRVSELKWQLNANVGPPVVAPTFNESYHGETSGIDVVSTLNECLSMDIPEVEVLTNGGQDASIPTEEELEQCVLTSEEQRRFVDEYFRIINTRYPVLNRKFFDTMLSSSADRLSYWCRFLLDLTLAHGSRIVYLLNPTKSNSSSDRSQVLYHRALHHLSKAKRISQLEYCQAMLLLSLYALRSECTVGPSLWSLIGMSMRSAAEIGLHRRQLVTLHQDPYLMEQKKRTFWSIYLVDRLLASLLGRPVSMPEHSIDLQLPVNVDVEVTDPSVLHQLRMAQDKGTDNDQDLGRVTNLMSMIHLCRLRRIESNIIATVYSPQYTSSLSNEQLKELYTRHYNDLDEWLERVPDPDAMETAGYETRDYIYANYFRTKRLVLKAQFDAVDPAVVPHTSLFGEFVLINTSLCQAYRALQQKEKFTYTPIAIQSIFLTGLNLAYCYFLDHESAIGEQAGEEVKCCWRMLRALADRWPHAKKYCDLFEDLQDNIFTERSCRNLRVMPALSFSVDPTALDTQK